MSRRNHSTFAEVALAAAVMAAIGGAWFYFPAVQAAPGRAPASRRAPLVSNSGMLARLTDKGIPTGETCPLKHTDVKAEITGYIARVTVTQEFENTLSEKIEAVYTFPLPNNSAVDDMTMLVGDRTIRGLIKRREEARAIYEQARSQGHIASLLDQERPNIFTQAVANIPPGQGVKVTISYVQTLKYDEGAYEFSFPMVVGPRYIPGNPTGNTGGGWAPDTDVVPDASRITPPVAPPNTRAGHDISLEVKVDAGVPIDALRSKTHEVAIERPGSQQAVVRLKDKSVIPNKDFVLEYDVAGSKLQDAVLAHRGQKGGFFTLILQPPKRVTVEDVTPKELVFVLDTSGSMMGFPIEKAKETMKMALDGLYPRDTFNLITFSGDTHILFPSPVPATPENLAKAKSFLESRQGSGGTEMMKAIRAALATDAGESDHVRIVCFMTDGFVGNDMDIIDEVKKHPEARVFSFGIGSSVNHFLLDGMANEGRGEVEYVGLQDDGSAAAKRFHERVRNPLLTDISIDWGGLPATDVYPRRVPDLFSAKPMVLHGKYTQAARGKITIRGKMSGHEVTWTTGVDLPASEPRHDVLATLWARQAVEDLMSQDWAGVQSGNPRGDLKGRITQLGLDYRLMTQFTSFVAVEERVVTEGGQPKRIQVPVEMPEGVSHEGVFGREKLAEMAAAPMAKSINAPVRGFTTGFAGALPQMAVDAAAPGTPQVEQRVTGGGLKNGLRDGPEPWRGKLHPSLASLVRRQEGGNPTPAADESRFVVKGMAYVEVWLTDATPAALAELKRLGFEETGPSRMAKIRVGRIAVEKLASLAALDAVQHISPHFLTAK